MTLTFNISAVVTILAAIANVAMSASLTVLILVLLIRYIETYNMVERLGHGIAGAAVFLSMFKQAGLVEFVAPFSVLYQVLWRVGWVLLLGGKLYRLERHRRANETMAAAGKLWRDQRGMP